LAVGCGVDLDGEEVAMRTGGDGGLPTFLLAGFPKAGTTSFAAWLSDHPSVFVPPRKEIDYFDVHWDRGPAWYQDQLRGAAPGQIVGDASPRYVVHPHCHARIAAMLPDVRIVVLVREPVGRAVSHYWYVRDVLRRDLPPLSELVEHELTATDDDPGTGTVAWGRYHHYLELLAREVDRDRICVVTLDALRERPDAVFAGVCELIGADPSARPRSLGTTRNAAFRHRSERLFHLMLRYHLYDRLPWGLGYRLEELNRRPVSHEPADPDVLERLRAHYAPHNAALTSWVGDLPPRWST
jgi:hypothetical protein